MRLSVIVPALNEERQLAAVLRSAAEADEIIVVDGGSTDRTTAIAAAAGARLVRTERGRGLQLACGARIADGDAFLFLHADTRLPPGFRSEVLGLLESGGVVWGRFDIRFDSGGLLLILIARLISWRSRLSRVATGDQAIFCSRAAFDAVGGVREAHLFEDVDLCRRLKRHGRMGIPRSYAVTSARRWQARGVWRTSFLMWGLKLSYLCGVPAGKLVRRYRDVR